MQASVIRNFGPPEVLATEAVDEPRPGRGQAAIEVELANITFVDTQIRAGKAPRPEMLPKLPAILGNGVAGRIAAVATDGDPALPGRRVMSPLDGTGGYAERAVADIARLIEIPERLPTTEALALLADGRTAVLLARAAAMRADEVVLVEAAAGGVGSLLVQLARLAGARVIAAAGGKRKLAVARELGADEIVDYTESNWSERLAADVDVVFDGVGGAIGAAAFGLVRPGGRFCTFGMASGAFANIDEAAASARQIRLLRGFRPTPDDLRSSLSEALQLAANGRLRPLIGQTFALEEAAAAHRAIERRETIGKTLLRVKSRGRIAEAPGTGQPASPPSRARSARGQFPAPRRPAGA
jgi:NADPH2:quinone reductase